MIKKIIALPLVVLCGVGFYCYKVTRPPEIDWELMERGQKREDEFMKRRAEYIEKHGDVPPSEKALKRELLHRNGAFLILPPSPNAENEKH